MPKSTDIRVERSTRSSTRPETRYLRGEVAQAKVGSILGSELPQDSLRCPNEFVLSRQASIIDTRPIFATAFLESFGQGCKEKLPIEREILNSILIKKILRSSAQFLQPPWQKSVEDGGSLQHVDDVEPTRRFWWSAINFLAIANPLLDVTSMSIATTCSTRESVGFFRLMHPCDALNFWHSPGCSLTAVPLLKAEIKSFSNEPLYVGSCFKNNVRNENSLLAVSCIAVVRLESGFVLLDLPPAAGHLLTQNGTHLGRSFDAGRNFNFDEQIAKMTNETDPHESRCSVDERSYRVDAVKKPSERGTADLVATLMDDTQKNSTELEMQRQRDTAVQANAEKSRFLANLSHELRTPLSTMIGLTRTLQDECEDPTVIETLGAIERHGKFMTELLSDLIDIWRIECGKLDKGEKSVALNTLVSDIETMLQTKAAVDQTRLQFDVRYPVPAQIIVAESRLRQILINLTTNALKFAAGGNVWVTVQCDDPISPECMLSVSVRDDGIGIAEENIESLFEPFQQENSSITRRFGGSGLGLSIVKQWVDAMRGTITVRSKPGQGSVFTVNLPVKPNGQVLDAQAQTNVGFNENEKPSADIDVQGAKVLVADDMRDARFIAKHFLSKIGCQVSCAEDGQQALRSAMQAKKAGDPFKLILLDVRMPGLDGLEVLQRLRTQGISSPIVALTAEAVNGTRTRLIEAGYDGYLPKPLDCAELKNCVRRFIKPCN